jgi:hypothetical protein
LWQWQDEKRLMRPQFLRLAARAGSRQRLKVSERWQRARIVFDCRIADDPAMMEST